MPFTSYRQMFFADASFVVAGLAGLALLLFGLVFFLRWWCCGGRWSRRRRTNFRPLDSFSLDHDSTNPDGIFLGDSDGETDSHDSDSRQTRLSAYRRACIRVHLARSLRALGWIVIISVALLFILLTSFDYISEWVGIFLSSLWLAIWWVLAMPFAPLQSSYILVYERTHPVKLHRRIASWIAERVRTNIGSHPKLFWIGLVALVTLSVCSCIFTAGMCVTTEPYSISTRFSRTISDATCPEDDGRPCLIYLTLPTDPAKSMIVNCQSSVKLSHPTVFYDAVSHSNATDNPGDHYAFRVRASSHHINNRDYERYVYWAVVSDLQSSTRYYFCVSGDPHKRDCSKEYSFVTFPADPNAEVTFVAGGDVGFYKDALERSYDVAMATVAAVNDTDGSAAPLFAAIGGDICYANGMTSCYQRWDEWLLLWQRKMATADGQLVPLLLAIGNHESAGYAPRARTDAPFYFAYFPQQDEVSTLRNVYDRSPWHKHAIAPHTVMVALDSGLVTPPDDPTQNEWIQRTLAAAVNDSVRNRIAIYHIPQWPSMMPFDYPLIEQLREAWMPLFDRFNLTVALENHDHYYMRTKPLRHGRVTDGGTVYLGDGAWGVVPRQTTTKRWYFAAHRSTNFFFVATVGPNSAVFRAVEADSGRVFDSISV